jgi:hypothetical protein
MGALDRAKTIAEIAELLSRIYGLVVDKGRATRERKQKIKELEAEVTELKKRLGAK